MKKAISLILTAVILLAICCGCSANKEGGKTAAQTQDNKLLPYGLEFGMSYNDAKNVCTNFPNISEADANDGYASGSLSPKFDDYEAFFGVDGDALYDYVIFGKGLILDPSYYFSFNESKLLYEFYVMTKIYDNESAAEFLLNEYIEYYEGALNVTPEMDEYNYAVTAEFKTDTLVVNVVLEENDGDFLVYTVVHNKTYELG